MTQCKVIRKQNFEISNLKYPRYVEANVPFDISFTITNLNWLLPDKYVVYLHQNERVIYHESAWSDAKGIITITHTIHGLSSGIYNYNLSVLDDGIMSNQCEDYKTFGITVLGPGENKPIFEGLKEYWYVVIGFILLAIMIIYRKLI